MYDGKQGEQQLKVSEQPNDIRNRFGFLIPPFGMLKLHRVWKTLVLILTVLKKSDSYT